MFRTDRPCRPNFWVMRRLCKPTGRQGMLSSSENVVMFMSHRIGCSRFNLEHQDFHFPRDKTRIRTMFSINTPGPSAFTDVRVGFLVSGLR